MNRVTSQCNKSMEERERERGEREREERERERETILDCRLLLALFETTYFVRHFPFFLKH